MNVMPPLTIAERAGLVESIKEDGIVNPVLRDPAGQVIDGYTRLEIASELGIDCPERTLDVDQITADRLRITLNTERRQVAREYRDKLFAELRAVHMTQSEIAIQLDIDQRTVSRALANQPPVKASGALTGAYSVGKDGKIYPQQKRRPPRDRSNQKAIAERKAADKARQAERKADLDRIRARDAEHLTRAAAKAPAGKLNLPALRMARQIRADLIRLADLVPPDRFVTQIPIEACREFTPDTIAWWDKVASMAAERLTIEGGDLPPLPGSQL